MVCTTWRPASWSTNRPFLADATAKENGVCSGEESASGDADSGHVAGPCHTSVSMMTDDWWEGAWAPYDDETYDFVLAHVQPADVALDMGAGDLRLARRLAPLVRRVVAIERQPDVLLRTDPALLPANLHVMPADALTCPLPRDVTVGILLMRHCRHVGEYIQRLRAVGCPRLITNARWGFGCEEIDLWRAVPWESLAGGWYGCRCGAAGFKPLPAERLTDEVLWQQHEVSECPRCINRT